MRELWATATTFGGMHLFYVVAERRYKSARRDDDCDAISLFQGWILEHEGRHMLHAPELLLSTCTEMQDRIARPFVVLTIDDRYFAVVEWSLYEGTERDVLEVTPAGVWSALGPQF